MLCIILDVIPCIVMANAVGCRVLCHGPCPVCQSVCRVAIPCALCAVLWCAMVKEMKHEDGAEIMEEVTSHRLRAERLVRSAMEHDDVDV